MPPTSSISHELTSPSSTEHLYCRYWQRDPGSCRYGDQCRFLHIPAPDSRPQKISPSCPETPHTQVEHDSRNMAPTQSSIPNYEPSTNLYKEAEPSYFPALVPKQLKNFRGICKFWTGDPQSCKNGDECPYLHVPRCRSWNGIPGSCQDGENCQYAHGVLCNLWNGIEGSCTFGRRCVYLHPRSCKFWDGKAGSCKHGDQCTRLHAEPNFQVDHLIQGTSLKKEDGPRCHNPYIRPCRHWNGKKGSCRVGDKCRYFHAQPEAPTTPTLKSTKIQTTERVELVEKVPVNPRAKGREFIFLIDSSGSMRSKWYDLLRALTVAIHDIQAANPHHAITLIKFSDEAHVEGEVRMSPAQALKTVKRMKPILRGTSFTAAFMEGLKVMRTATCKEQAVVFMTDGLARYPDGAVEKLICHVQACGMSLKFHGIGLKCETDVLKRLCEQLRGQPHFKVEKEELIPKYREVVRIVTTTKVIQTIYLS
jgi:Mg-chelatase subunit ChlD